MRRRLALYIEKIALDPATNARQCKSPLAGPPSGAGAAAVLFAFAVGLAGCSYAMGPLFGDSDTVATNKATPPISAALDAEDWRRAKAALAVALDPTGNGQAVHWDNPASQANGAFRPLGNAYAVGTRTCRTFTADVVTPASDQHLQGEACREPAGEWSVSSTNPTIKDN
jgi:surface antigen